MYKMSVEWKSTMQLSMIYLQFNYQVQYSTTIILLQCGQKTKYFSIIIHNHSHNTSTSYIHNLLMLKLHFLITFVYDLKNNQTLELGIIL